MRKPFLAISMLAVFTTAAFADPVEERQALMKSNGGAMAQLAPILKGEKPFDAGVAMQALQTLADDAAKMDPAVLWPEGSTGGDSKSSPKIWEDKAGFQAAIDKFKADTAAAVAANPADLDALKTQVGAVGANCGSCHRAFRT